MKTEIIAKGPIEELLENSRFNTLNNERIISINHNLSHFDRRSLLKIASISAISYVSLPIFLKENIFAQSPTYNLIFALIQLLQLLRQFYQPKQPTNGIFTLANEDYEDKSGLVQLKVVGRGSIEDLKRAGYDVPARQYVKYQFDRGPVGTTPGNKILSVGTAINSVEQPFRIETL